MRSSSGPLISDRDAVRVADLVSQTIEQGTTQFGAEPSIPVTGAFHPPIIMINVTTATDIAHQELFGPVTLVPRFMDEAEALTLANDTPFGLASYVYTDDAARQWRMMKGLEYGMVGVNDGLISTEVAPFCCKKESGFGPEGSSQGLAE